MSPCRNGYGRPLCPVCRPCACRGMAFMRWWAASGTKSDMGIDPGNNTGGRTLSILTVTTLFPNPVQPVHGVFVETRLRKLLASGAVAGRVIAPVPWLPPGVDYPSLGPLHQVPRQLNRDGLLIDHPRYIVVPKIGMAITPYTL